MTMKERPILFSAPMIRAILEGRKTQTRRAINPQPEFSQVHEYKGKCLYDGENRRWCWKAHVSDIWQEPTEALGNMCPYGKQGDRLYAKETFALHPTMKEFGHPAVFYRANDTILPGNKWRPSIFMPRWASRITLEITSVRVERLNEISEEDAKTEGCESTDTLDMWHVLTKVGSYSRGGPEPIDGEVDRLGNVVAGHTLQRVREATSARDSYRALWESINGPGSWDETPWVWVVTFKRVKP